MCPPSYLHNGFAYTVTHDVQLHNAGTNKLKCAQLAQQKV